MPMRLTRQLFLSALVLGSFGTITDGVLAGDVAEIRFKCKVPRVGKDRCGDENRNVRVGPSQRLTVQLDTISPAGYCVTFYVMHAVSGALLGTTPEMCQPDGGGERAWANPQDEPVDVFMNVSSTAYTDTLEIEGRYRIDKP